MTKRAMRPTANEPRELADINDVLDAAGISRNAPDRWKQLAIELATAMGLIAATAVAQNAGGRPHRRLAKRSLARRFDRFRKQHPRISQNLAADRFLKTNKEYCGRLGYSTRRSLLKAYREGKATKFATFGSFFDRRKPLLTRSEQLFRIYSARSALNGKPLFVF